MTHHDIVVYALALIGAGIAYSGFCRAVVMRKSTHRQIRYAMSALTTSAFAVTMTGLFDPHLLGNAVVATFASMLWVQWVTSKFWHRGVPHAFERRDRRDVARPVVYGVERRGCHHPDLGAPNQ
jgi:hypothetical protein